MLATLILTGHVLREPQCHWQRRESHWRGRRLGPAPALSLANGRAHQYIGDNMGPLPA